jgi:CP family cyanate transporter-like MFS transporter
MTGESSAVEERERTDRLGPSRAGPVLLGLGIVLVAANLRPAITAVPPLIGEIRADVGMSNGAAGLLTALPLLAFGLLSSIAPRLAFRFGMGPTMLASMLVLCTGIVLRSTGTVVMLFSGTFLLGVAIAIGNVLLPSLVRKSFPERTGMMTSVYSTALAVCAALAAGLSVSIADQTGLGWRASLSMWAVPALIAAMVWLPQLRDDRTANASARTAYGAGNLWRSALAWQVTLFMGLQSLAYYVTLAWLPEILKEHGMEPAQAGWMLALNQTVGIVSMFLAPVLAVRRPSQRAIVAGAVALIGTGILGLLLAASVATTLWVVLLGLGLGACFSLALTFFALRAPDSECAAALSGMAQSVGYTLAAVGPFLFGVLRDVTHAWTVPLILLFAAVVCLLITGLGAARNALIARPNVQPDVHTLEDTR